jgi:hypothetical protein
MAQLFNIDTDKLVSDLLPPEKRDIPKKALLKGVLSAFKRLHSIFYAYMIGDATATTWSAGTYTSGAHVKYKDGSVYECMVASTTAEPTASTDWLRILDSFIGTEESQNFNATKLELEYALNKRFGTTYVNPPINSPIYISNITPPVIVFRVGGIESISSSSYNNGSDSFVINDYSFPLPANFTINIPSTTYNALGTTKEKIVRMFVDKYNTIPLTYTITPY